ncbi:hypothetical protein [Actinomadura madurae]|uniref:hypothetical protein n=1 Tax=Actinomadura madurae TaxID=1993 RepID=UPI0020D2336A|nr:hypothetical protein [Actinomadura madurae]MCQ0012701.1 hypothetical protein [Actinomadura madurae]
MTVSDPVWDEAEGGLVADVQVFPQWHELLNPTFAEHVGLSIRATGVAEHGEAEGREGPIVKSLNEGISVDWVTRAGAGGRVLELIESARGQADEGAQIIRLWEAKYDAAQLKALLAKGQAMKNASGEPSYPIADEQDLKNAIRAVGRGGADHDKIRAHIIRRAKALGKSDLIPADWASSKTPAKAKESAEPPTREELREAGATIGARIEARTHTAFTILADDMYCDGRLTRAERLTLSSALGDALGTLVARLEKDAPQLYQRGPWSYPPDENGDEAPMEEAAKKKQPFPPFTKKSDDDLEDTGGDVGKDVPADDEDDPKAKTAPGSKPADKKMKENGMPELTEEQARQLTEAAQTKTRLDEAIGKLDQATQLIETQGQKIETLETALAEAGQARPGPRQLRARPRPDREGARHVRAADAGAPARPPRGHHLAADRRRRRPRRGRVHRDREDGNPGREDLPRRAGRGPRLRLPPRPDLRPDPDRRQRRRPGQGADRVAGGHRDDRRRSEDRGHGPLTGEQQHGEERGVQGRR